MRLYCTITQSHFYYTVSLSSHVTHKSHLCLMSNFSFLFVINRQKTRDTISTEFWILFLFNVIEIATKSVKFWYLEIWKNPCAELKMHFHQLVLIGFKNSISGHFLLCPNSFVSSCKQGTNSVHTLFYSTRSVVHFTNTKNFNVFKLSVTSIKLCVI